MKYVRMVPSGYEEVVMYTKDEWKYANINNGAQYVMIAGTLWMHKLPANS